MLADEQHRVDVEAGAAPGQGAADAGVHGDAVLAGEGEADVVLRDLVDVEGDDVDLGREEAFVGGHALEELGDDGVGVGGGVVDGAHRRHPRAVGHVSAASGRLQGKTRDPPRCPSPANSGYRGLLPAWRRAATMSREQARTGTWEGPVMSRM